MNIKYSEIFTSFQGEAGFAGMPTIWVRMFGCNLECNGFNQKTPTDASTYQELPFKTINISEVKTLEELPVFSYGCDSSYSWSKRFSKLARNDTVEVLVDKLIKLGETNLGLDKTNKNGFWKHPKTSQKVQLCFTGGEPMLWQKQIREICKEFELRGLPPVQITIETNGTQKIKNSSGSRIPYSGVFYSVSPKLFSVSGEKNAIDITTLREYFQEYGGWLKFVVNGSQQCWDELDFYCSDILPILPSNWEIWVMPVGATKEQQECSDIVDIVNEAMKRGFKIATRNHVGVFGNVIGS